MKRTRIVVMVAGIGALFAANAVADGQVGLASDGIYYVSQEEAETPPSDVVPEPDMGSYDDSYRMESRELFPETCGGLQIGGWFQMGYHTEGTNGDGTGFFNNYPNVLQLQQAYIHAEKAADNQGYGWDWGFRMDYVYGTDGQDTQAFGSRAGQWDEGADNGNFYGHAIPQLYADVVYNDVKVRVGHFYTFIGYEAVPAPDNFFYSKSGSLFFEPFTHTGFLAEWAYSDSVTFLGGWSLGWDTGFSNNGGSTFLGGVNVQLTDSLSFAYGATAGDFGFADAGGSDTDAYEHSIVLDWQVTERLNYVLQSDYLDNRLLTTSTLGVATSIFTVNQYLLYDLNDRWGVGGRLEWLKGSARGELWIATLGANWRPRPNLVVRPEIRYEDFDPAIGRTDQTLFGIDAIITF